MPSNTSVKKRSRALLWVATAAIAVYGWMVVCEYVQLDDDHLIRDNARYLANPAHIVDAFERGYAFATHRGGDSYYRPLVNVSYIIDALIAPASPHIGHATNILLHAAVSCLVLILFRRFGMRDDAALALALIFAVHPLASNAVGWIPGRNDLLLALFSLLSFIFVEQYIRDGSARSAFAAMLAFAAALLSKETAIALPLVAAVYVLFIAPVPPSRAVKISLLIQTLGLFLVWVIVRSAVLGGVAGGMPAGTTVALVIEGLPAALQAFGKCVFPFELSALPVVKDTSYVWGIAAVIAMALLLYRSRDVRRKRVMFGLAWFLVFLGPSLLSQFEKVPTFLECRIYVPLIGVLLMVGEIDAIRAIHLRATRTRMIVAAALLVLAGCSIVASMPYRDRWTFWENAVRTSPDSPLAHGNLGSVYVVSGRVVEAEREFRSAVALNPDQPVVHHELGSIHFNRGEIDSAEIEFRKELSLNPNYDFSLGGMGSIMYMRGQPAESIRWFKRAVETNPEFVLGWQNLGRIYRIINDRQNAAACVVRLRALGASVPPDVAAFVEGR